MDLSTPFSMEISWNNGAEKWFFPVLPERVTIKRNGTWKDYNIVGLGAVATIQKPELAEIRFESFFPGNEYPFVHESVARVDGKPDANRYVHSLNKWMHSGYPVRFTYVGSRAAVDDYKIRIPMTIASFERWEEAGSPGDIFYSLSLKEYVFYAPQKVRAVQQADGSTQLVKEPPPRLDMRVPPKTWTLKPGETLIHVSRMALGDSGRWREIQKLNNIADAAVTRLPVGLVLQLPEKR